MNYYLLLEYSVWPFKWQNDPTLELQSADWTRVFCEVKSEQNFLVGSSIICLWLLVGFDGYFSLFFKTLKRGFFFKKKTKSLKRKNIYNSILKPTFASQFKGIMRQFILFFKSSVRFVSIVLKYQTQTGLFVLQ